MKATMKASMLDKYGLKALLVLIAMLPLVGLYKLVVFPDGKLPMTCERVKCCRMKHCEPFSSLSQHVKVIQVWGIPVRAGNMSLLS